MGAAGDDIFAMIARRFQSESKQGHLLLPAVAAPVP
jgi:hypothetical protein